MIQANESRLLSLNNMDKWKHCKNIKLGILKSVSQNSIVMSHVMNIDAKRGLIYPEPEQYVKVIDKCDLPGLTTGKMYFFEEANFYANLDGKSVPEALHFILSVCQA